MRRNEWTWEVIMLLLLTVNGGELTHCSRRPVEGNHAHQCKLIPPRRRDIGWVVGETRDVYSKDVPIIVLVSDMSEKFKKFLFLVAEWLCRSWRESICRIETRWSVEIRSVVRRGSGESRWRYSKYARKERNSGENCYGTWIYIYMEHCLHPLLRVLLRYSILHGGRDIRILRSRQSSDCCFRNNMLLFQKPQSELCLMKFFWRDWWENEDLCCRH